MSQEPDHLIPTERVMGATRCMCWHADILTEENGWCCSALTKRNTDPTCSTPPEYVSCLSVRGSPECRRHACTRVEETLSLIEPMFKEEFSLAAAQNDPVIQRMAIENKGTIDRVRHDRIMGELMRWTR